MCNDFGNRVAYSTYVEEFNHLRLPLVTMAAAPNLEPRDDIWPTETTPVIRRRDDGVELVQMRWGFAPGRPKAPPVINYRSEGRRFGNGRCLVPASHFFEFTGEVAEIEVALHQIGRRLVLLCGAVATRTGRRPRKLYAADHRTWT